MNEADETQAGDLKVPRAWPGLLDLEGPRVRPTLGRDSECPAMSGTKRVGSETTGLQGPRPGSKTNVWRRLKCPAGQSGISERVKARRFGSST